MNPSSPGDNELVRGLHVRDHAVFAQVYATFNQAVYNLCARILGDREEARDVTQEVFLTAFSRPPAVSDDVRLRAWLFRVATNACLNVKRGSRPGGSIADFAALPAAGDAYEQARTANLIERSLGEMNPRYRAALVLKDLQGLDTAELAGVMEVSRGTADVLVHRARAAFRTVYSRLAGEGAAAPASLALVLAPLELPASLAALPPFVGALPAPVAPTPAGPAALGPAGVGLLAKLGAGLGIKAAIVAAGATVVVGGGIVLHEKSDHGAIVAPAPAREHAGAGHDGGHHGEAAPHDTWAEHRRLVAEHAQAGHQSGTHGAGHEVHHAGQAIVHATGHGGGATAGSSHADHAGAATTPSHHAAAGDGASQMSGGHSDDGHAGGSGDGS